MIYKICVDMFGNKYGAIRDNDDGTFRMFMFDEQSSDYQKYLEWLAEGNEPLPADEEPK